MLGGQRHFFLVRENHARIDVKNQRAHVPARARILTFVWAWALASAVPDASALPPARKAVPFPTQSKSTELLRLVTHCHRGGLSDMGKRCGAASRSRTHPLTAIMPLTQTHRGPRLSLG